MVDEKKQLQQQVGGDPAHLESSHARKFISNAALLIYVHHRTDQGPSPVHAVKEATYLWRELVKRGVAFW